MPNSDIRSTIATSLTATYTLGCNFIPGDTFIFTLCDLLELDFLQKIAADKKINIIWYMSFNDIC